MALPETKNGSMFITDPTVFTVEKLIRKRKRQGSYEYLVKWRDYNFRHNTWEPESNILDQRLLDEFDKRHDVESMGEDSSREVSDMSDEENLDNNARTRSRKKKTSKTTSSSRRSTRSTKPSLETTLDQPSLAAPNPTDKKKTITNSATTTAAPPSKEPSSSSVATSRPVGGGSKFTELMKKSRKQAQSYVQQFKSPPPSTASVVMTTLADVSKTVVEDGKRYNQDEESSNSQATTSPEPEPTAKRRRPVRSCTVPSGFWEPVKPRSEARSEQSEIDDDEEEEEEIFRVQRKSKNFELAPPNFYSCYSIETTDPEAGDEGADQSVFPKKKFTLKPPILDLSKKPLSDFVFEIEDLWASSKVETSTVKANGVTVKIMESKCPKTIFSTTDAEKKKRGKGRTR